MRTRLYFTSESHIHALFNLLKFAKFPPPVMSRSQTMSFNGDPSEVSPTFEFPSQVSSTTPSAASSVADGDVPFVNTTSSSDPLGSPMRKGDEQYPKDQWKRAVEYLSTISELNYLTQIVFRLFRRHTEKGDEFVVEVIFTPGQGLQPPGAETLPPLEPLVLLHPGVLLNQLELVLRGEVHGHEDLDEPRSPFIFDKQNSIKIRRLAEVEKKASGEEEKASERPQSGREPSPLVQTSSAPQAPAAAAAVAESAAAAASLQSDIETPSPPPPPPSLPPPPLSLPPPPPSANETEASAGSVAPVAGSAVVQEASAVVQEASAESS